MIDIPHFDAPFRFNGSAFAVVEQDSAEEIEDCVEAVLRTPVGSRIEAPEFGCPDETFAQLTPEPSAESYLAAVAEWEPRARLVGEARFGEVLGELDITISEEP